MDTTDVDEVILALTQLTETIEELLKYGRDMVKVSTDQFINQKVGKMFGMASAYNKCFQRAGVETKEELERKIHRYARNAELRTVSEELLDLEHEWDKFFKDIDKGLQTEDEISAAEGKVVVVSFGVQDGAQLWLKETQVPFPMLLDEKRKIYHSFGLHRSVFKVWGVEPLVYYAEAMKAGKSLPKPFEQVHDDPQQMGGDFILDMEGKAQFLYPSQTSRDRPPVSALVEKLKELKKK